MTEWLSNVLHCQLYGKPVLTGIHIAGNAMIVLAYFAIPIALEITRRRRRMSAGPLLAMFAAFIFLCGLGHALMLVTLYVPGWYWVKSANDVLTGIVSLATAVYSFVLIPSLSKLRTPEETEIMEEMIQRYRDDESLRQLGKQWPREKLFHPHSERYAR